MCIAIEDVETPEAGCVREIAHVPATPAQVAALDPQLCGMARQLVARRKADAAISIAQLANGLRERDPHKHAALLVMLSGGALG